MTARAPPRRRRSFFASPCVSNSESCWECRSVVVVVFHPARRRRLAGTFRLGGRLRAHALARDASRRLSRRRGPCEGLTCRARREARGGAGAPPAATRARTRRRRRPEGSSRLSASVNRQRSVCCATASSHAPAAAINSETRRSERALGKTRAARRQISRRLRLLLRTLRSALVSRRGASGKRHLRRRPSLGGRPHQRHQRVRASCARRSRGRRRLARHTPHRRGPGAPAPRKEARRRRVRATRRRRAPRRRASRARESPSTP